MNILERNLCIVESTLHNERLIIDKDTGEVVIIEPIFPPESIVKEN